MKKEFELVEQVTFRHTIEVDIDDELEEEFEEFADEIAEKIEDGDGGMKYSREDIVSEFVRKFGEEKVTFKEDGSPEVEWEAF